MGKNNNSTYGERPDGEQLGSEDIDGKDVQNNGNNAAVEKDYRYRNTSIIFGIFAILFAIAFIIMLILFFMRKTENTAEPVTFVYDMDGTEWSDQENLSIFYNELWGTEMVAPDSLGTYAFVLKNESDYTLKYSINLREVNEYDIAMCYKLKRDGNYVLGGYVRTDDFWCNDLTIEANSSHYFELEWFWDGSVSDYNDTLAGINESIYTLTITITATKA